MRSLARRAQGPLTVLFRAGAASPPGVIPLTYGFPDPGSFPAEELIEASTEVLRRQAATALQYGPITGYEGLLDLLVAKLAGEGITVTRDNLLVTAGASQAVALLCDLFLDPGDPIVIEAPTFIGSLQAFRNAEADAVEVPLDDDGMDTAALADALARLDRAGRRPKFIYTIPQFQNPAGVTLSLTRRRELLELARGYEVLVVEDDAYSELRFAGEPLPSLYSLAPDGLVIQTRTFSKILAAGLRLGYLVGHRDLIPRLAHFKVDVGTSPFASHVAVAWARGGRLQAHIERLRAIYGERRDALLEALAAHAPDGVTWTRPEGGFFTWLTLPEAMDAVELLPRATEAGVTYIPGTSYFAGGGGARHLRLAFSFLPPDQLAEGVRRLSSVIRHA